MQDWEELCDGEDGSHKLTSLKPGTKVAVKFKASAFFVTQQRCIT